MTESTGTADLRDRMTSIVLSVDKGELATGAAVNSLLALTESVHQNAVGYGQLLGEERVLDALIEGRLGKPAARHWWDATKQKIKLAQR